MRRNADHLVAAAIQGAPANAWLTLLPPKIAAQSADGNARAQFGGER
jgi:hypothetical protein